MKNPKENVLLNKEDKDENKNDSTNNDNTNQPKVCRKDLE